MSAIQLEANHTNNQIPSDPQDGSLPSSTTTTTTTTVTTATTTSAVQEVTLRSSENSSKDDDDEDDLGLFPDRTTDEDPTLLLSSSKLDLASDVSKLVPYEDLDEENDAKLFWDVVNSIQQWQDHKEKLDHLKKHGGLTRYRKLVR